jgi:uncharacterized membrane protein
VSDRCNCFSMTQTWLKRIGVTLSFLGMAFMAYLLKVHYSDEFSVSFCDFAPGFSCDIVNKSVFSEVFGVPIAFLGLMYFVVSAAFFLVAFQRTRLLHWLLFFSSFSLVFSLYLSWVEWRVLGTICVFCEGSKIVMIGITGIVAREIQKRDQRLSVPTLVASLVAGVLFAIFSYSLAF